MNNSDIDIGTKIKVSMVDGYKGLNIVGEVIYIHDRQFVIKYPGANGENIVALPLPKIKDRDTEYEIIKNE